MCSVLLAQLPGSEDPRPTPHAALKLPAGGLHTQGTRTRPEGSHLENRLPWIQPGYKCHLASELWVTTRRRAFGIYIKEVSSLFQVSGKGATR